MSSTGETVHRYNNFLYIQVYMCVLRVKNRPYKPTLSDPNNASFSFSNNVSIEKAVYEHGTLNKNNRN